MGWQYWEIKDEWAAFRPHLERLWDCLLGRSHRSGGYLANLGHAFINLRVEFRRCFAYTNGHLPPAWLWGLLVGAWVW